MCVYNIIVRIGCIAINLHICIHFKQAFFLQALKAKAITEGKIHGPRAKQQQIELAGPVEYEPFDFPDGEL